MPAKLKFEIGKTIKTVKGLDTSLIYLGEAVRTLKDVRRVKVECYCGNFFETEIGHIRSEVIKSCGCLSSTLTTERNQQNRIDLTDEKFGRLLVVQELVNRSKHGAILWECVCTCGNITKVLGHNLRNGSTQSCGCLSKEIAQQLNTKHGQSRTKEYRRYSTMKYLCAKDNRTPNWADMEKIKEVYKNCPKGMSVDHVIPLRGKLVSGLHVHDNLQYLTKSENSRKGCRYPQC